MRYLILILMLSLATWADTPAASAIIAQLQGQALGKSPTGRFTPASLMPLVPGSLLKLPAGTRLDVRFFSDGHHELYTGPCVVGIGARKGTAVQGPAPTTSNPLPTLSLRAADLAPAPSPQPSGTNLSLQLAADGKPQFSWTSDAEGPYMLEVSDPPKAVWGVEVAGSPVEYGGPALNKDETYVWSLSSNGKQLAALRFAVPTAQTIQNLGAAKVQAEATNQPSHNALLATAYEQNGMIQDAVICSRKALEQAPDDPGYMRRLSTVFQQAGQYAEAHRYEEQARFVEDGLAPLMPDQGFYDMYWDYYGY